MDERLRLSLLYDFYGELLTKKQAEAFEMYYFDDFSLHEIAENYETSRQAVSDLLRRTNKILENYEKKLKLVEKHLIRNGVVSRIQKILACDLNDENKLNEIKPLIEELYR